MNNVLSSAPHSRRRFLAGLAGLSALPLLPVRGSAQAAAPALVEARLLASPAKVQMVPEKYPATSVWAYNGTLPGPVLRVRQGDRLRVRVQNDLEEPTTVHWHGIRLPNEMDGVPYITQRPIDPGKSFTYEFSLPDAGTFFYHPHQRSYEQVGRGLAGALIVEERTPPEVDRDVLWVLGDYRLNADASIRGGFGNFMDESHAGRIGNTVTLNGHLPGTFRVRAGERIRLRLINAAPARRSSQQQSGADPNHHSSLAHAILLQSIAYSFGAVSATRRPQRLDDEWLQRHDGRRRDDGRRHDGRVAAERTVALDAAAMNRGWRIGLAFACAAALASGVVAYALLRSGTATPSFNAVDVTGADWGKDFALLDHHGKRRTLADFRGKAVMLFFGFTHCPDVCPTALATLARARGLLGEDAARVQGLFVTVDPKRDTPEILSKYVTAFDPTFLGLYGDEAATEAVAREFKIYYRAHKPDANGAYGVDHSGQVYVIDSEGRLRLYIRSHDAAPEAIAHDLRLLLGVRSS